MKNDVREYSDETRGFDIFRSFACLFSLSIPSKEARMLCSVSLRCRPAGHYFPVIDFSSTYERRVLTPFFSRRLDTAIIVELGVFLIDRRS